MDNPQLLATDADHHHDDCDLESVLDDIIQIKRQNQPDSQVASKTTRITDKDRIALLERYRRLETLKNQLNGRFLFEYDEGLETLVKEVIV